MNLIQSKAVVTKQTTATLTPDDIKKLVAADLGVDPKTVVLNFRLKTDSYDGPGNSTYIFSHLEIKVEEPQ